METYFAPADRANPADLEKDISFASHNPIIDALMGCVGGLLAVINERRQILALNA
jgi:hypothetical protein